MCWLLNAGCATRTGTVAVVRQAPVLRAARATHPQLQVQMTCNAHHMHLACLAQFRAQASSPSELLCPLCRHSRCPACSSAGWTRGTDAALRDLCELHGVQIPERISGENTVRAAVPDYAVRTFTTHDAPEPRPPPGVSILCCHHVAALGRAGGVDFMRLPDRTMRWAPVAVRHDAGIAAWQPSWMCMGCAQSVQLDDLPIPAATGSPCDTCGGILQWEYDRAAGVETFGWSRRCAQPRPAPLPVSVAIRPEHPHESLTAGTAQPGPIAPAMPENAGTPLAQQHEAATAAAALEPPAAQSARPQLLDAPTSAARGCELPSGTWYGMTEARPYTESNRPRIRGCTCRSCMPL